jgi:hypothetical protein
MIVPGPVRNGAHSSVHVVAACARGVGVRPAVVVRITLQFAAKWPAVGCAAPNSHIQLR